ncbi:MAG: TetR/AcrR family transcriptional regulator [bacterium]
MKKQKHKNPHKGDGTRARIIETTLRLISEKGPDAVSMRELSQKLGFTKPVLYYYFKNKEELIRAAFTEGTRDLREIIHRSFSADASVEEKISSLFLSHLDFFRKFPDAPKCALRMLASPSKGFLKQLAMEMKEENQRVLRKILKESSEKDGISPHAVDDILRLVDGVMLHLIREAKEGRISRLDKGLPARLTKIICKGLKK